MKRLSTFYPKVKKEQFPESALASVPIRYPIKEKIEAHWQNGPGHYNYSKSCRFNVYSHSAQEWLNKEFPTSESRQEIKQIKDCIKNGNMGVMNKLTGELIIENFPNLEEIDFENSSLTKLQIINCPKLAKLVCGKIKEIDLDSNNFPNLEWLKIPGDLIADLNLQNNPKLRRLEVIHTEKDSLDLDLSHLTELEDLTINKNNFAELSLSGISKVKEVIFSNTYRLAKLKIDNDNLTKFNYVAGGNYLTNLDLSNCSSLVEIYCRDNKLVELILPKNASNLETLTLYNNNFHQDLSFLQGAVNLENLSLQKNKFFGSLKYLKEMNKLRFIDISNTDIDSGLEYLPDSVKSFNCSVDKRKDAKCQVIYDLFADENGKVEKDHPWERIKNFSQKLQWIKFNFSKEERNSWIKAGLKLDEHEFADYLRQKGYQPNIPNIKEVIIKERWQDIHQDLIIK
ncbi:MAG: hypothetical protein MRECE_1c134 [Mycoplasmataceae bacterium CE_OT135]|nr:MAG: hypothetical protein MRECE_1c033 [Mycoplasmataceae bacterium CE_OT135]KLL04359.1 MAG: hypothetical protein MRECE_1c134 [Mycoplasmataceae bacterium CE_OT135]